MPTLKPYTPLFLIDTLQGVVVPDYSGELLVLAEDLGRRLLPAFDTPTGMQEPTMPETCLRGQSVAGLTDICGQK